MQHSHTSPARRAMELLRAEHSNLVTAIIYSVAVGLLSLVLPVSIQALVNSVAFGSVLQPILVLTLIVAGALIASAVLYLLRTAVLERMQRRIFVHHTSNVLDRLLRVRAAALDQHHAPELVNRFLDVVTVQKSSSDLVVDGLTVGMQMLAGLALLAAYHPYLLVFDVLLMISIVFVLFGLGRGAVASSISESQAKYDVLGWLEEVARQTVTFRSQRAALMAIDRTDGLVREYLRRRDGHFRIWFRQVTASQMLQAVALSGLLGIGGYLVIQGELTLGQLVAAELVVSLAVGSFAKFGKSLATYYDLLAALDKLGHLTDLPVERSGGFTTPEGQMAGILTVEEVSFEYPGSAPLLRKIGFRATRGARIAIHGRGAVGKSTLMDLLFGLRTPVEGRIELDGIDYRHLDLASLRRDAMLIRGTEIFPGTVYENVTMGAAAAPEEVRVAIEQSGAWDAVMALPRGMDTQLTASGRPLSPSQALRLVMARAIFHKPRLLLIDEALDSIVDLQVGGLLVQTLFDRKAPWTLVLTTERVELWPLCDQVFCLEQGELREEDTSHAVAIRPLDGKVR